MWFLMAEICGSASCGAVIEIVDEVTKAGVVKFRTASSR
jgi:hypothetical protein